MNTRFSKPKKVTIKKKVTIRFCVSVCNLHSTGQHVLRQSTFSFFSGRILAGEKHVSHYASSMQTVVYAYPLNHCWLPVIDASESWKISSQMHTKSIGCVTLCNPLTWLPLMNLQESTVWARKKSSSYHSVSFSYELWLCCCTWFHKSPK